MVDITQKQNTHRTAVAQAIVRVGSEATIAAIKNNTVPKGNVFSMSKAAGFLGIKKNGRTFTGLSSVAHRIRFRGI